mgnify:CR=1 FL=1
MGNYKTGQILNFKYYDGVFQWLIAFANKHTYGEKGYTHSAIISEIKEDSIMVAEALSSGFNVYAYEEWWLDERVKDGTISIGNAGVELKDVKNTINKYLNRPYAWYDIFNIGFYFLFGKYAFKISDGSKALICSEAVCRVLYDCSNKKIDFEKEFNKPFDTITPEDLSKSKQITWS